MLIQNPGFEDGLVGWRVESLAGRDDQFQPANEEVEVVSTQALQGGASLKLRVFSDNQGNCLEGPRRARQFLSPNDGMAMTAPSNHVTVFARGWRWDTPSRYNFENRLYFNNGALDVQNPDAVVRLFRRNWDSSRNFNKRNGTRTGIDGNTWSRFTVEIPGNIDLENMSMALVNWYDTWDCNSGWGRTFVDSFQFTDATGTPLRPDVAVSGLTVPRTVTVGNPVAVEPVLMNKGEVSGTVIVDVTAGGTIVGSKKVTVPAGGTETVQVTWTPETEGSVEVCAGVEEEFTCRSVTVNPSTCAVNVPVLGEVDCGLAAISMAGILSLGIVTTTTLLNE